MQWLDLVRKEDKEWSKNLLFDLGKFDTRVKSLRAMPDVGHEFEILVCKTDFWKDVSWLEFVLGPGHCYFCTGNLGILRDMKYEVIS